jgi:hypothetical protein
MSYEIKQSVHGPVVIYEGQFYFIGQTVEFFGIFDAHPEILFDITNAVIEHVDNQFLILKEALSDKMYLDTSAVYGAITLVNHYYKLVFHEYPEYRKALTQSTSLSQSDLDRINSIRGVLDSFYHDRNR